MLGDVHAEDETLLAALERWFTEAKGMLLSDATPAESLSEESVSWLQSLPALRRIPTVSGAALLCHSLGRDDLSRLRLDDPIDPSRSGGR